MKRGQQALDIDPSENYQGSNSPKIRDVQSGKAIGRKLAEEPKQKAKRFSFKAICCKSGEPSEGERPDGVFKPES